MKLFAVIPTYNRPALLRRLLERLDVPAAHTIVLNTGDEPLGDLGDVREVFLGPQTRRNISKWWNIGLSWASLNAEGQDYAVLVLNDDVEPQGPLAVPLAHALEQSGADIAYPTQDPDFQGQWTRRRASALPIAVAEGLVVDHKPYTPAKPNRLTGWCFLVRGDRPSMGPRHPAQRGLRADEGFVWWYGDNDLEWRAQLCGGTVEVAGVDVLHLHPGEQTAANPQLKAQTRVDRRAWFRKWGRAPW